MSCVTVWDEKDFDRPIVTLMVMVMSMTITLTMTTLLIMGVRNAFYCMKETESVKAK